MRIAMVCLGNICRSPMAEAVARSLVEQAGLADAVEVVSYGTAGYHEGEPADPGAVAALRRHGWPAEGHRARRLRAADVAAADLVVVADRANRREVSELAGPDQAGKVVLLRSFDPAAGLDPAADLPTAADLDATDLDPADLDPADLDPAADLHTAADLHATDLDDEIPDPYGGGPAAFDRSLELIEAACRGLIAELAAARR